MNDVATGTHAASAMTYSCPVWSSRYHTLLAWRQITTAHAPTLARPAWTETVTSTGDPDSGIVQTTDDVVADPASLATPDQEQHYSYAAEGDRPPYSDLLTGAELRACSNQRCTTASRTLLYDEHGNVVSDTESADGTNHSLRILLSYAPNTATTSLHSPRP